MDKSKTPWFVALLVWMGLSTWWHTCKIKELCDAPLMPVAEVTAPAPDSLAITAPSIDTLVAKTEEDLAAKEKYETVFKPIDLYFKTGSADYIKTKDTEKFMAEAKKYLADHKDQKLSLTGHADNVGADDINMKLSQKRATDVKNALAKNGISDTQIATDAKGEAEPKADNATAEGRKANRRVTVVVQ